MGQWTSLEQGWGSSVRKSTEMRPRRGQNEDPWPPKNLDNCIGGPTKIDVGRPSAELVAKVGHQSALNSYRPNSAAVIKQKPHVF